MLLQIHLIDFRTITRSGSTIFFLRGNGVLTVLPSLPERPFDSSGWLAIHSNVLTLSQIADLLDLRVDQHYNIEGLRIEAVEFV